MAEDQFMYHKTSKRGAKISTENIKCIRPSHGLEPKYYEEVLGKKATKDLFIGDRLTLDFME